MPTRDVIARKHPRPGRQDDPEALNLTHDALDEGRMAEAYASAKALAEQDPANPAVWMALAEAAAGMGTLQDPRLDEALDAYARALEHALDPAPLAARAIDRLHDLAIRHTEDAIAHLHAFPHSEEAQKRTAAAFNHALDAGERALVLATSRRAASRAMLVFTGRIAQFAKTAEAQGAAMDEPRARIGALEKRYRDERFLAIKAADAAEIYNELKAQKLAGIRPEWYYHPLFLFALMFVPAIGWLSALALFAHGYVFPRKWHLSRPFVTALLWSMCASPLGLVLMWSGKVYSLPARIIVTMLFIGLYTYLLTSG